MGGGFRPISQMRKQRLKTTCPEPLKGVGHDSNPALSDSTAWPCQPPGPSWELRLWWGLSLGLRHGEWMVVREANGSSRQQPDRRTPLWEPSIWLSNVGWLTFTIWLHLRNGHLNITTSRAGRALPEASRPSGGGPQPVVAKASQDERGRAGPLPSSLLLCLSAP